VHSGHLGSKERKTVKSVEPVTPKGLFCVLSNDQSFSWVTLSIVSHDPGVPGCHLSSCACLHVINNYWLRNLCWIWRNGLSPGNDTAQGPGHPAGLVNSRDLDRVHYLIIEHIVRHLRHLGNSYLALSSSIYCTSNLLFIDS
jgi:hypothetical protein